MDFTRLQPPYSFSLLHCRGAIFSVLIFTQFNPFICTLKKKTLRTLLNSPRPQWKAKSECPALPVRRPRLNQTNASFDAQEGRARASPPPATALSIAHPALPAYFSPRTSQPNTELASVGGERGGKQRSPEAPPERPQRGPSRPLPPGQTHSARKGVGREPRWPIASRAGKGGVSRLLFPEPFFLSWRS